MARPFAGIFGGAGCLVQFRVVYPTVSSPMGSPRQFSIWRADSGVFQDVSAYWFDHVNLANGSDRELVPAALVTPDFFRLFGAPVLHGRTFTRGEGLPQGGHVTVLTVCGPGDSAGTRR